MTEDEKSLLKEEFTRAGSLPALLEAMARSESEDFRQLRHQVEKGTEHPTGEVLYNYVLGWLDRNATLEVLDHLVLCGRCLQEVITIRRIEESLTEDALARADKLPWIERVKDFVSSLSFPVSFIPALEPLPRGTPREEKRSYAPGTSLKISVQAPADGYLAIFHCCEETGEVDLVFPREPDDIPQVSAGQEIPPIEGDVEGPPGKQFFKAFWTRELLLDPTKFDLQREEQRQQARDEFFDALEDLNDQDWQVTTCEYEVV